MPNAFYTPSEVARILGVPHRRVLERLAAGEIEGERDPRTGRWKIPKESLNGSETERLSEGEARWREEKELLLAELHRERARADKERERGDRERENAAHERERAEGVGRRRREREAGRSKGPRWRLFGGG